MSFCASSTRRIESWSKSIACCERASCRSAEGVRDDVRFYPEFLEAIAELGMIQWDKGRYFTGPLSSVREISCPGAGCHQLLN